MAKSTIFIKHPITLDSTEVTSFATQANLQANLKRHGIYDHQHLEVQLADGRWTAIYGVQRLMSEGGYLGLYSQHGYMTIG